MYSVLSVLSVVFCCLVSCECKRNEKKIIMSGIIICCICVFKSGSDKSSFKKKITFISHFSSDFAFQKCSGVI